MFSNLYFETSDISCNLIPTAPAKQYQLPFGNRLQKCLCITVKHNFIIKITHEMIARILYEKCKNVNISQIDGFDIKGHIVLVIHSYYTTYMKLFSFIGRVLSPVFSLLAYGFKGDL